MRGRISLIMIVTILSLTVYAEEPVYFADANLKAAVENSLGVTNPTPTDMLKLTYLDGYARGICDLTGIEYATNLQSLDLYENQVSDLLPLSSLMSLQQLWIGENPISDISPLSKLINLQLLWISSIQINNISPLSSLTNLQHLSLADNQINDISPLAALTNLQELNLYSNQINDISPLSGLTGLRGLLLNGNHLSDISSLSGLTDLEYLGLASNQISDLSPLSGLVNLQDLHINSNQINDITSLSALTGLEYLGFFDNQISDISPLSGLTNLQELLLGNNQISDILPLSGLINLEHLDISNNRFDDLTPLAGLTNLTYLDLGNNQIRDISLLSGLAKLEWLKLHYNQIDDISQLSCLTNLQRLWLYNNQIYDISALFNLIKMRYLYLNNNKISDISVLSRLVDLQYLNLNNNQVSDISPLSGITGIQTLWLQINPLGIDAYTNDIPLLESYGTKVYYDPLIWRTLTIGSTVGGSVIEPGEGDFDYINSTIVNVSAVTDTGYYFAGWTGTAVDSGMVADPASTDTMVTMNIDCTLRAEFEEIRTLFIYVDDDATGANNGSSWENAYIYLQDALAEAGTAKKPVEIRVAQGIYKPDQGAGQTLGDREASFHLVNDTIISGGYAGINPADPYIDPNTRDIELYKTILSGDLNGDDVEFQDAKSLLEHASRQDNSNHVCSLYSPESTAVIDGFEIVGGNAFGYGGGITWALADLEILNCTFKDNTASEQGGAIFNRSLGELTFTNCTFIRNASQNNGGAISNGGRNPTMRDCIFRENFASSSGGAVYNISGELLMIDCLFEYNSSYRGGGVYIDSEASLINCTFTGNNAEGFGGGFYNSKSNTLDPNDVQIVESCTFKDNYAAIYGGGTFNSGPGNILIKNCLYVENSSSEWGGAIHFWRSAGEILNCTIAYNSARRGGGLCCGYEEQTVPSYVKITNSILWDNSEQIYNDDDDSQITIAYSCIQGLIPGRSGLPMGIINRDPLFADPNSGDYHLKSQGGRWDPNSGAWMIDDVTSPCIDTGDPNTPVGDEPFPNGGIINMGAYGGSNEASKSYLDESH